MTLPAKTSGFNALTPEKQKRHREKIGIRVKAILGSFWQNEDTPAAVQAVELEGWMDVLEVCSHSEIRRAWANYQRFGPRTKTGKLYRPDAGAIFKLIEDLRPKPKIVDTRRAETREEREAREAEKAAKPIVDPERAAFAERVLAEVGFKRFGGEA